MKDPDVFQRCDALEAQVAGLREELQLWEQAARWLCSDTWGRDALWTVIIRHGVDRKPCSCDMCGNPRRHHGKLSVGEQRQQAAWREAVDGPY